jgi:DNA-binding transcriptional MerR regulator
MISDEERKKYLLTVTKFAEVVGITADTLRFYDKEGVFRPAEHGEGERNKHRLYDPAQITVVNMIRVLTEIGIPLETITELSQDRTPNGMLKLLSKQRYELHDKLQVLQDAYAVINTYIELLISGISAMEDEIIVSEMPEIRMTLGDVNDFTGCISFYKEFVRFCHTIKVPNINLAYPIGGYFESMTDFMNHPSQPTRFFSLDPKGRDHKEAGLYLIGYTRGYYGVVNDLPERMAAFAEEKGLVFTGHVYQTYLFDEVSEIDPKQYLLQVTAAVSKTQPLSPHHSHSRF